MWLKKISTDSLRIIKFRKMNSQLRFCSADDPGLEETCESMLSSAIGEIKPTAIIGHLWRF